MTKRPKKQRYCGMCDKYVPARQTECKACGADTEPVPVSAPHTRHDMNPPFPGPCEIERPKAPQPVVDLMEALRRALPKESR